MYRIHHTLFHHSYHYYRASVLLATAILVLTAGYAQQQCAPVCGTGDPADAQPVDATVGGRADWPGEREGRQGSCGIRAAKISSLRSSGAADGKSRFLRFRFA